MEPNPADINSELNRRQKAASRTIFGLLVAVVLLALLAFIMRERLIPHVSPTLDMPIRITILILAFGSIAWRRTKFQTMRLQDIAALQGSVGLLKTLERTTLQLAVLAAAIAAIGFVGTLLLANEYYTYSACGAALLVLIYSYPIKSAWERTVARFSDSSAK